MQTAMDGFIKAKIPLKMEIEMLKLAIVEI
jgi:hypothetical protein